MLLSGKFDCITPNLNLEVPVFTPDQCNGWKEVCGQGNDTEDANCLVKSVQPLYISDLSQILHLI